MTSYVSEDSSNKSISTQPTHQSPTFTPSISFHSFNPIPSTKKIISKAFKRRGLIPSTSRDKRCLVQWTPRSRVSFKRAHSNTILTSSFFINQGLTHKDRLFAAHSNSNSSIAWAIPKTYTVKPHTTKEELIETVSTLIQCHTDSISSKSADAASSTSAATSNGWILKQSQVNNALGLIIFQDVDELTARFQPNLQFQCQNNNQDNASLLYNECKTKSVLQEYITNPLLLNHCKFHIRVNVMVTGGDLSTTNQTESKSNVQKSSSCKPQGFVHTDFVAHVASEKYKRTDWKNKWIHVTNHGVQKEHPNYNRCTQTLSLTELEHALVAEHGAGWVGCSEIFLKQSYSVIRNVLTTSIDRPGDFRPMMNSFEMFGFDFVPKRMEEENNEGNEGGLFQLQLLEVNGGPALEGVARPDLCEKIVEDVIKIVIDPFLEKIYAVQNEEVAEKKNETDFVKVWERGSDDLEMCDRNFVLPNVTSKGMIEFGKNVVDYVRNHPDSDSD